METNVIFLEIEGNIGIRKFKMIDFYWKKSKYSSNTF